MADNKSTSPTPPPRTKSLSPDTEQFIEPDSAPEDDGYVTDAASCASTSLSSSVRDYTFEHNRRFHKFHEGQYVFPNDEPEQEREDMKHAMVLNLCDGKLHFAPLKNPQKVLDIGTGTGIWAVDMGDEYPEADILGIDLSPIQPTWVPPNVRFMIDDAEAEWVHPPETFDYIHMRHMVSSFRDWSRLLSQAYTSLKPGGYIEMQEMRFILTSDDNTVRPDNKINAWLDKIGKGMQHFNLELLAMEKNQQRLREAGFVNVNEMVFKIPMGTWPKDPKMKKIGNYNRCAFYDALFGISIKPFTTGLKMNIDQVELFLKEVRDELMDRSNAQHGYIPFHITIGQKPL